MGSSYYGEPNYTGGGGGGGSSSSSSTRKGNSSKKGGNNSNSEKAPKQPQRGLGVAQLEKIRLNSQLNIASPNSSTNYNHLPTTTLPPQYNYPPHFLNQEEMRIQTAYPSIPTSSTSFPYGSSASSYGFHAHQNAAMGLGQLEGANARYSESQPSGTTSSQYPNSGTLETPYFAQHSMTRHYPVEDSFQKKRKKERVDSIGSSSQNSNPSDSELDLELKLSL